MRRNSLYAKGGSNNVAVPTSGKADTMLPTHTNTHTHAWANVSQPGAASQSLVGEHRFSLYTEERAPSHGSILKALRQDTPT